MDRIDLRHFQDDDGFTVQFIGPPGLIAVDTLVETLSGFNEALETIGQIVDPDFDIEVYVDSVSPGSVKIGVKLKKKLKKAGVLALAGVVAGTVLPKPREIVTGLFTNYLYDQIKHDEKCTVVLSADKVTVKGDNCDVTIAREVYDLIPKVEGNPKVANGVKRALQAVKKDTAVTGVGVSTTPDRKPEVFLARAKFDTAIKRVNAHSNFGLVSETDSLHYQAIVHETRTETKRTNLVILKAWLMRNRRKWSFNWQGLKISAAIKDADFFNQLEARSIALHQGDALDADLAIVQRFLPGANVWQNVSYTVTKVYSVRLGETQTTMDFTSYNVLPEPRSGTKH